MTDFISSTRPIHAKIQKPTGSNGPLILAIETSCDETAVAVLRGLDSILASEVSSQIPLHQAYGGVVPEVASRAHLTRVQPLLESAVKKAGIDFSELDAVAATSGPGLASSLMIGCSAAKGLALGLRKPFIAVNHLEGHLLSPFFGSPDGVEPSMALVVSGGHTMLVDVAGHGEYRLIGQTQDDAAGEAFDKIGKLLGLPYPGGPQIDRLAKEGNRSRYEFPRSMKHSPDFHFSFSGLKTSVRYRLQEFGSQDLPDVCASFQEAVVDVLVHKTLKAAQWFRRPIVAVSGGVSCNSRLREAFQEGCDQGGVKLKMAAPALSTDNAAMIAFVAALRFSAGERGSPLGMDIDPNLRLVQSF